MKLQLYFYRCKKCDKFFKIPHLTGTGYGEFLMRNKKNEMLYLNAFEDIAFDEVKIISRRIMTIFNQLNKLNEGEVIQTIFSVACDEGVGANETSYHIGQKPTCPYCNQENVGCWGPTDPPESIEADVKLVTHEHWNTLTEQEKYDAIYQAIADYFSIEIEAEKI